MFSSDGAWRCVCSHLWSEKIAECLEFCDEVIGVKGVNKKILFWNDSNRKGRLRFCNDPIHLCRTERTAKAMEKISFEAEEKEPRTVALIPCEKLDGICFY